MANLILGRTRLDRFCFIVSVFGWVVIGTLLAKTAPAQTPLPQTPGPQTTQLPDSPAAVTPTPMADQNDNARWPLHVDSSSGQITVYQPQMTNFDGDKLSARAAVSVIPPGQTDPVFGAIWMESRVATDRAARTVQVIDIQVTKTRFPDATGPTEQTLTDLLRSTLPKQPMTLSLDQLLAMMQVVDKEKQAVKDISNAPPKILFRGHASVLVQFDGDPRFEQVENSPLLHAVNTPFFIALEPQSKQYYLKGGGQWFAASQALGPYNNVNSVPPTVSQFADSSGYKDPQTALSAAQAAGIEIVTATQPSELIWTDGPEQMAPLDKTDLLYVANTDCDIFLNIGTQQIYILVSGRWFTSPHKSGPWAYVAPDKLPPDFANIDPASPKGDVLAHVSNTQQAKDAVADTYVPQTAAINRQNFEQPTVNYDGDPQFQPVPDTTCSYAVNTPSSVVRVDHDYYCCSNAVWYTGHAPHGPWLLCERVPDVIYTIPPSCPVYPCRYCYVYDVTPDVVYCGYLPGYVGCYHYDGVVVYGTGYYYHPWVGEHYYARPCTYGFAAHYDDYHNHWGFSIGLAFGEGAAWIGDRPYGAHEAWFGHGGYRPIIVHDNRTVNVYRTNIIENRTVVHNVEYNVYDRRKDVHYDVHDRPEIRTPSRSAAVAHGDVHDARPADHVDARGGVRDARDNVYADRDGNVYRRTDNGWEQRSNNKWTPSHEDDHAAAAAHDDHAAAAHDDHAAANHAEDRQAAADRAGEQRVADQRAADAKAADKTAARRTNDEHVAQQRTQQQQDLDRDFHARVEGEQRAQHSEPSESHSAPSESHASTPHESGGGGGGGGGGGHSGGGGGGSPGSGGGGSKGH